jgi:hypothetical protein
MFYDFILSNIFFSGGTGEGAELFSGDAKVPLPAVPVYNKYI